MHFVQVRLTHSRRHCEEQRDEAIHKTHRKFPGLLRFARNDGKCAALSLHTPCYRNMSISFLLVARQKKRNRRKKRKHANVPCISLTLNAQMLFELSAQILSRLTITLRARSPDTILPDVIASSDFRQGAVARSAPARKLEPDVTPATTRIIR